MSLPLPGHLINDNVQFYGETSDNVIDFFLILSL